MPYPRPTLSTLRSQAAADIDTANNGANALLRFSNLKTLATIIANAANGQYGYLDWIALQAVPFTATDENLIAWGSLKKVFPKDPTQAMGVNAITFPGTAGVDLPLGSEIRRQDGTVYVTTADATVSGSQTVIVSVQATVAGANGNCAVGTVMTLASTIPGIQSNGTVTTAITGGADAETAVNDDSYRARMLQAYQQPPQGGAQSDYETWALQVSGVTRAWSISIGAGIGTVVVYPMFDNSDASFGGFPQGTNGAATAETRAAAATGDQLTVANYIYPLRPATAVVLVCAPIANPINFTISGLSGASTSVKSAIAAAISGVFLINGSPLGQNTATTGMIDLSDIQAAINAVSGTEGYVITSPSVNISNGVGYLPVLGTITYTT